MNNYLRVLITIFISASSAFSTDIISLSGTYTNSSVYVNEFPLSINRQDPLTTRCDHLTKFGLNTVELQLAGTSSTHFTYKDSQLTINREEDEKYTFLPSSARIESITKTFDNDTLSITIVFNSMDAPKCKFPWENQLNITDQDKAVILKKVATLHSYFEDGKVDKIIEAMENKLLWFSNSTGTPISKYRNKVSRDISSIINEKKKISPLNQDSLIIQQVRGNNLVTVSLPDRPIIEIDCGDYSYNLMPMYSKIGHDWVLVW